jgi:hypothetical protein
MPFAVQTSSICEEQERVARMQDDRHKIDNVPCTNDQISVNAGIQHVRAQLAEVGYTLASVET